MNDPRSIYQPPDSNLERNPNALKMAERSTRLMAVFLDGLILSPITVSFYYLLGFWQRLISDPDSFSSFELFLIALFNQIIYFLVNGYGLKHHGQSLGKRIMGIRIVNQHGQVPGFINLIVYRYLSITILSVIPVIGNFLAIFNALLIFRFDKRCLHDHFCGTIVVVVDNH